MGMTNALNLLCGLALFLYGMHVMGEGKPDQKQD